MIGMIIESIAINREDILEVVFTASEYGGAISATSSITTIDGMVLNEHITGNHPVYCPIQQNSPGGLQ